MEGLFKGIYPVITEKFCLNGSSVETLECKAFKICM